MSKRSRVDVSDATCIHHVPKSYCHYCSSGGPAKNDDNNTADEVKGQVPRPLKRLRQHKGPEVDRSNGNESKRKQGSSVAPLNAHAPPPDPGPVTIKLPNIEVSSDPSWSQHKELLEKKYSNNSDTDGDGDISMEEEKAIKSLFVAPATANASSATEKQKSATLPLLSISLPVIGGDAAPMQIDGGEESQKAAGLEWDTNDLHDFGEGFDSMSAVDRIMRSIETQNAADSKEAKAIRHAEFESDLSNIDSAYETEWSGLTDTFSRLAIATREAEERDALARAPLLREVATNTRIATDVLCLGELREKEINRLLDSLGLVRTKQQRQFHKAALVSMLPQLYGKELDTRRKKVMDAHGIKELRHEILVMTPRRYGKTTMVAMFGFAILVVIPGLRVAIFSTGKRASQALMDLIVGFTSFVPGVSERICKKNQEKLAIAKDALRGVSVKSDVARDLATHRDTSVLMALPANEKGKHR